MLTGPLACTAFWYEYRASFYGVGTFSLYVFGEFGELGWLPPPFRCHHFYLATQVPNIISDGHVL